MNLSSCRVSRWLAASVPLRTCHCGLSPALRLGDVVAHSLEHVSDGLRAPADQLGTATTRPCHALRHLMQSPDAFVQLLEGCIAFLCGRAAGPHEQGRNPSCYEERYSEPEHKRLPRNAPAHR